MNVTVHIVEGPLPMKPAAWDSGPGCGALVTFEGIARPDEGGRPIEALDYEAYEPMASKQMRAIGHGLMDKHALHGICVEHSTGRVGVGDRSLRLRIAAKHRQEALAATAEFIDGLKKDVPIWKQAVYTANGA